MNPTENARYYVHDRGAGQARELRSFSAVNPRYLVIDRETGRDVDAFTTKRSAEAEARVMNARGNLPGDVIR
jgi:hypothetical protein